MANPILRQKLADYSKSNTRGLTLVEDYQRMGDAKTWLRRSDICCRTSI